MHFSIDVVANGQPIASIACRALLFVNQRRESVKALQCHHRLCALQAFSDGSYGFLQEMFR